MRLSLLASLALGALACGPSSFDGGPSVALQDSFELNLFRAQDDLHTPYVNGAHFVITVGTTGYPADASFLVTSSDPSVIDVGDGGGSRDFSVNARGTGTATLRVVDAAGHVYDQRDVQVDEPDSVQLEAHGLLLAGESDDKARVTQASVVEGGTETFLVRYLKGSQPLYGNGAVSVASTGAVVASMTSSSFTDDNDWVLVQTEANPGPGEVNLAVGGRTVATIPSQVVAPSTVASVGLLAQSEDGASDGRTLMVFARAFDAQGNDVYGASYSWTAGGAAVPANGLGGHLPTDVLQYTYKASATETLTASLEAQTASVSVHGGGAATVESSAQTGCTMARGTAGATPWAPLALVAALALGLTRRRASPARASSVRASRR